MRAPLLLLTLLVACGKPPVTPHKEPAPPKPLTPHVHFTVDASPQDSAGANGFVDVTGPVRYGDPFDVVVDGVAAGSELEIDASMDGLGSHAIFTVPADNVVDLARDAPKSGTWQGVDAEGILWSMDGQPSSTLDLGIHVDAKVAGKVIASADLKRKFIDAGLTTQSVQQGTVVGQLALPPGDGPFPAVLVFGGSEGGVSTGIFNGDYLGSLGYATLGVGYFGAAGLPQNLSDIPLEILEDDLAFLASQPHVDPNRIAVYGGSRGGELALLLGAHFPIVKAVIADVPSGVVWPGFGGNNALTAAWTLRGREVPFVPDSGAQPEVTTDAQGNQHYTSAPVFIADLHAASREALAAATIRVEDTHGPILLLGGADDKLWASCVLEDIAWRRLLSSGHAAQFHDEVHCFENAGHLIGTPGWSTIGSDEFYEPSFGAYLVTGGTPAGMAAADRASDTAIRKFLEVNL
jgi:dienelactone hydrolase